MVAVYIASTLSPSADANGAFILHDTIHYYYYCPYWLIFIYTIFISVIGGTDLFILQHRQRIAWLQEKEEEEEEEEDKQQQQQLPSSLSPQNQESVLGEAELEQQNRRTSHEWTVKP